MNKSQRDNIEQMFGGLERLKQLEKMEYWIGAKVEDKHPGPMPIEVHGVWSNHGKFWPSEETYEVLLKDIRNQIKTLKKELNAKYDRG